MLPRRVRTGRRAAPLTGRRISDEHPNQTSEGSLQPESIRRIHARAHLSTGTAHALAWLSQLAYETDDPKKVADILGLWGLQLVGGNNGIFAGNVQVPLPLASTHGLVAAGHGAVFVTFAGTDPAVLANWITDFDVRRDAAGTAQGYRTAVAVVFPKIRTLIQTQQAGTKVYLTGHSLGGTLAAITALQLNTDRVAEVEAVYTIGMPRPGEPSFATTYNGQDDLGMRTYRMVHGEDVVPTVAPSELDFRHVGRLLHCPRQGKFDAKTMEKDAKSDAPLFVSGVSRELVGVIEDPLSSVLSFGGRVSLAMSLVFGIGPTGGRTDPVGIAIELLPPRIRDHITDRYISAL